MGSPTSPIVANLYMEEFEVGALNSAASKPDLWLRYVDDTYVIIHKDNVEAFSDHINSRDTNIKFTREEEDQGQLPFLDVLVVRGAHGQLSTQVYRKKTHTHQYLNFNSHHPLHQKLGVVSTLTSRAVGITSGRNELTQERKVLRTALSDCDYPRWAVDKGMASGSVRDHQASRDINHNGKDRSFVSIPYVSGTSEALGRVLGKAGFKVAMKPCRTLRQELVAPRTRSRLLTKLELSTKLAR